MEAACSVQVEAKVVSASTRGRSYVEASRLLEELAELDVSAKECERITQRIGRQRVAERTQREQAYEELPLPRRHGSPADLLQQPWENRVAAVLIDGGRAQVRDERWGKKHPPGEKPNWWREPKVACVATFFSSRQAEDPIPEVPACLLDPLWVIPRVKEIKRGRCGEETEPERTEQPGDAGDEPSPRWSPEPLVRSVVATFEPYERLGRMAQVEAYHRGFAAAPRKVFLGDGHRSNWTVQQTSFPDYTPVVDLMHALSYVYHAALESTPDMQACWVRCRNWITWVWQGRVQDVIAELGGLVETAQQERSREVLEESLGYLTNNASRMRYDAYRRSGLPITSTLIESTVKQISRRMKGTEKFWGPGAEPQLQLCADQISETNPLASFWERRQDTQTGFRKSRATT